MRTLKLFCYLFRTQHTQKKGPKKLGTLQETKDV